MLDATLRVRRIEDARAVVADMQASCQRIVWCFLFVE
jgi:hypothetical protein